MRPAGLAGVIAAGLLAAGCAGVREPGTPPDATVATAAPSALPETMTVVLPASRGLSGRGASALLRATFVSPGVYADPRVLDLRSDAGPLDAEARQRLEGEALRAFEAVHRWRFTPRPDAVLPAPGSPVEVRVRFMIAGAETGRD